jgi:DNA-binding IclR family transcriptional regulator
MERNSIQVVSRAARILGCLENEPLGLSLGVIASRSELPRSTVQRLVDALAFEHLIEITAKGVRLGPALLRLAARSHIDITRSARAPLERLAQRSGETAALVYSCGTEMIMLDAVISSQELRVAPMVNNFLCLYATAAGKICLAQMSDDQVTALLHNSVRALTSTTLTLPELLAELQQIRCDGLAFDYEEHQWGVGSAAIGAETAQGFYAISVVGPSWRIREQRPLIVQALEECQASLRTMTGALDQARARPATLPQ